MDIENISKIIEKNSELLNNVASICKWLSYFAPGRLRHSEIISEMLYSMSNLVTLINESNKAKVSFKINEYIGLSLTALEYSEACYEMIAEEFIGVNAKWVLITFIQILKSFLRYVVILKYNSVFQLHPPSFLPSNKTENTKSGEDTSKFVELSSGRRIKTIFSPVETPTLRISSLSNVSSKYHWRLADLLYTSRPLIHLSAFLISRGRENWLSWLLAGAVDLISLLLINHMEELTPDQTAEVRRRAVTLLYYLLRSPCYHHFTRSNLHFILKIFSDFIPLAGYISRPFLQYLDFMQHVYLYMWVT